MAQSLAHAPFTMTSQLRFRQGDPGGITFFAQAYALAHDAFEEFVSHLGFAWKDWFQNKEWGTPIRNSSCEHLAPLMPGQKCSVGVLIEKLGESSLNLKYVIESQGKLCAEVKLVHIFVDFREMKKIAIPSDVRERLEAYQRKCLDAK